MTTKKKVNRIAQSPMNPMIWVLELECGHDKCITQKTRPINERTYTDKATKEKMYAGPRVETCERCAKASR